MDDLFHLKYNTTRPVVVAWDESNLSVSPVVDSLLPLLKVEGADEAGLIVRSVMVDEARGLKRMLPAPQGRAYRMKKRSNHVTLIVDTANN